MVLQGLRHSHLLLHGETLEPDEAGFFGRFVPQDLSGSHINLSIPFYFSNGNWATFRETFLRSVLTHGSSHFHLSSSLPFQALPGPASIFCQPCFVCPNSNFSKYEFGVSWLWAMRTYFEKNVHLLVYFVSLWLGSAPGAPSWIGVDIFLLWTRKETNWVHISTA